MFDLGGVQGGQGSLFGRPFSPGSIFDRVLEAFSGPHDFWNDLTGTYNPLTGNQYEFPPMREFLSQVGNVTGVLIVAPIAVGGFVRSENLPVGLGFFGF